MTASRQPFHVAFPNQPVRLYNMDPAEAEAYEYVESKSLDALLNFPQSREGIDFGRIVSFIGRHGLRTAPVVVIQESQVAELNKLSVGLGEAPMSTTWQAVHSPSHETIVSVRGKAEEIHNGPEMVEANIIHELGHAQQAADKRVLVWGQGDNRHIGIEVFRNGLKVRKKDRTMEGSFFAEAYAELLKAKYTEEVLQKPFGFANESAPIRNWNYGDRNFTMHTKYVHWHNAEHTQVGVHYTAFPAYAFELMTTKKPEIVQLLDNATRSVQGVRPLIEAIEDIRSGLYPALRRLPNSNEDFTKGLFTVVDALGIDSSK